MDPHRGPPAAMAVLKRLGRSLETLSVTCRDATQRSGESLRYDGVCLLAIMDEEFRIPLGTPDTQSLGIGSNTVSETCREIKMG